MFSCHMNMLYIVLFVFILTKVCQANANTTATDQPTLVPPPPSAERRALSHDLAHTLRRQLMRDNYDYQTGTDDEHKKRNKQNGGADPHIPRTMDALKNSNTFSADRDQRAEHEQRHARDPSYARESHYTNERRDPTDHMSDLDTVPDGVDPADTHDKELRDALRPDSRDDTQDGIEPYDPTYNRKHDAYNPTYLPNEAKIEPENSQRLRANAEDTGDASYTTDRYVADDEQEEQAQVNSDTQDNPNTHYNPDIQDNSDTQNDLEQQDTDDTQAGDKQETDYTENKTDMQAAYDSPEAQGMQKPLVMRSNRLKHIEPKRSPPRDHNIAKKDLLYYMDDDQLRRNNDVVAYTKKLIEPAVKDTERTEHYRSKVITISPSNVTYKLLKMRSRDGRRSDPYRFVEERAPDGVALISLDHAPIPAMRLPRSRRQYMH